MIQKRQLSECPYCYKEGVDLVGDALSNTTCSVCGAELRQEEVWENSSGPGSKCRDCGIVLEAEYDETGRYFAVCQNSSCQLIDECIRELTILKEGKVPEGVKISEPDSWDSVDESINTDWMIDKEYDDGLSEGDDDIDGCHTTIKDIGDDPSYEEALSRYNDKEG